ncbi:MAG: 50S ribosomal protein L21 [Planctomycetota bacterium]
MYAVFMDRGRQYRVEVGDEILVDSMDKDAGDTLSFDEVAMVGDGDNVRIGTPMISGVSVNAEVLGQAKGKKLVVFKMRRRKNSRVKNGHRQKYTRLKIQGIQG